MKNNKLRILIDILLIILGVVFLIFGIKDFKEEFFTKSEVTDGMRFHREYNYVSEKESIYTYIKVQDYLDINDDSYLLIGSNKSPLTNVIVKPLNDIAKQNKVKLYYIKNDISDDKNYNKLLKKIKLDNLDKEPIIVVIKNKKVTTYTKENLYEKDFTESPIEYWTDDRISSLNELLNK